MATAAEATAKGVQKQLYDAKYARNNVLERNKRMVISPMTLDQQLLEQKGPREAARTALVGVLGRATGEPQQHWEPIDIQVIPMKGKQQGKHMVIFKMLDDADVQLIMSKKGKLKQGNAELFIRVWLDQEEAANKKIVMAHPAFKEAKDIVFSKPKHTEGYRMGWDLDRAYTIINGQKTYWHADDLKRAAQAGAAGGTSDEGGAMEQ